jgi:hypothetical protein
LQGTYTGTVAGAAVGAAAGAALWFWLEYLTGQQPAFLSLMPGFFAGWLAVRLGAIRNWRTGLIVLVLAAVGTAGGSYWATAAEADSPEQMGNARLVYAHAVAATPELRDLPSDEKAAGFGPFLQRYRAECLGYSQLLMNHQPLWLAGMGLFAGLGLSYGFLVARGPRRQLDCPPAAVPHEFRRIALGR